MRQITSNAVSAFFSGMDFCSGNTTVYRKRYTEYIEMRLHNNIIAVRKGREVWISSCGWETPTTKERLNGILDYMGEPKIYQKDFWWYWKDGEEFPDGMVKVK